MTAAEEEHALIELGARHAEVVRSAIRFWAKTNTITESQASLLDDTIVVQGFDWEKFAKYALRLAVFCLVVAVGSLLLDASFVRIYKRIKMIPPGFRAAITCSIATGVHVFAHLRSQRLTEQKYANEAIHGVGAVLFALAALQVLEQLDALSDASTRETGNGTEVEGEDGQKGRSKHREARKARQERQRMTCYAVAALLAMVYAAVGFISRSPLIWSCSMMVLGYSFCGLVDYTLGADMLFLHWPPLFAIFGGCMIGSACLLRSYAITVPLWSTTRVWGMLYFFVAVWFMSLLDYAGFPERSRSVPGGLSRPLRTNLCSVFLLVVTGGAVWHGLRFDDTASKGFGLTFLGIHMHTKLIDYFWGRYKPLFFAVLAILFAVAGKYAEDVWNGRFLSMLSDQSKLS